MKRTLIFLFIPWLLTTCGDDEVGSRSYPRVRTQAVTDINSTGALFQGEITFSSTAIIDHGFMWYTGASGLAETFSLGPTSGKGKFQGRIERSLAENVKYHVKAYARSADHIVYGDVVDFISLGSNAPKAVKIIPEAGTWGDTLLILGENFARWKASNVVKFNDVESLVVKSSEDSLQVIVPAALASHKSDISVSFSGNGNTLEEAFELRLPEIDKLSSDVANVGDQITITGKYLRSLNTKVTFGTVQAEILELRKNEIVCKVPSGNVSPVVMLRVSTGDAMFAEVPFTLNVQQIHEIIPALAFFNDVITIKGQYLVADLSETTVDFGGVDATVISATADELQVIVPANLAVPACKIGVTCNGIRILSTQDFRLKPPVIESINPIRGSPGEIVTITGKYLTNGVLYFGNEYSPFTIVDASETEIQFELPDSPPYRNAHGENIRVVVAGQEAVSDDKLEIAWVLRPAGDWFGDAAVVVINSRAYLMNATTFWSFNGQSDWRQLERPDGLSIAPQFEFDVKGIAYYGSFEDNSFWAYDPSSETWMRKNDIPFENVSWEAKGFSLSDKAFALSMNGNTLELWKYDDAADDWDQKPPVPFPLSVWWESFVIGNDFYVARKDVNQLWKFNVSTEAWTNVGDLPFYLVEHSGISFAIGNYGYIVNAMGDWGVEGQVWRFDAGNATWHRDVNYCAPWDGAAIRTWGTTFSLDGKGYVLSDDQLAMEFVPPQE
jgi:hypothetical protein